MPAGSIHNSNQSPDLELSVAAATARFAGEALAVDLLFPCLHTDLDIYSLSFQAQE